MKQKTVLAFGVWAFLALVAMFGVVLNVPLVRGSGSIHIRADGSVDPPDAPISSVDNITYTFTDNIYNEIVVERSNIIVDGNGSMLQGTGSGFGFYLYNISGVTIKNVNIKAFQWGIRLNASSYNTITQNNMTSNWSGIHLYSSSHNTIAQNNITDSPKYSISIGDSSYNTIAQNNIANNRRGIVISISLSGSSYNTITQNNLTNVYHAMGLWYSSYNTIAQNNIANTHYGIAFRYCRNITITQNNITNNDQGITIAESPNNRLRDNVMAGNQYNFGVLGGPHTHMFSHFIQDVDVSNTVDGKPVYYWVNRRNAEVPSDAGYVALVNCTQIVVRNLTLTKSYQGVSVAYTSDSSITQNNIANNWEGISLYASSNITLRENVIAGNKFNFGVWGYLLSHFIQDVDVSNTVDGKPVYYWVNRRNAEVPSHAGYVALVNCTEMVVGNLTLTNNRQGVLLAYTNDSSITQNNMANNWEGIGLYGSSYNTVTQNNMANNRYGVFFYWYSSNNTITQNNITDNGFYSILLHYSSNNIIYHNNFVSRYSRQVYSWQSVNDWDNGYPSGGNYWSDYIGVDEYSGPNQDQPGSDGIGDTPYEKRGIIDRYPFMQEGGWAVPVDTTPPVTTISLSDSLENSGWYKSNVTITLTATDISGVAKTAYSYNNATWIAYAEPFTVTTEGIIIVYYNSTDKAGNVEPTKTQTMKIDKTIPSANAGIDQTVTEDTLMTFNGSASFDNIGIVSYTWAFTDVTPKTLTGVNPTYTFATPGIYTVTLNVTDAAGNWDTDEVVIAVVDVTAPVADAGSDQTVDEDTLVTMEGWRSKDNVGIKSWTWTFTDVTPQTLTGENITYAFKTPSIYTVTLNVTDTARNYATDTAIITVLDVTEPVANVGLDQRVAEDTIVSFDASGSSDNVGIVSCEWVFGDGTTGTGRTTVHSYTEPGTYTVTLTVKDAAGNSDTHSITITVLDVTNPVASAGPDQTVSEDTLVTFNGSQSSDNVDIMNYMWTFVDITPQALNGTNPTYNFTTSGTYTVTLTVEDAAGNNATDTVSITVLLDTDGDGTPDVTDTDDDNDGMPDSWEIENGLDPLDALDASLDSDGDGLTNLQEYQADTDPNVSDAEAFPLWILGAAAALIGIAVAATFLWRRRK